jgi:hypothetical protein
MKSLTQLLVAMMAALCSVFRFGAREECHNSVTSTVGTHANGIVDLTAEAAVTTRYLLVRKGTAANGFLIGTANARPWGVCLDEPESGDPAAVQLLAACAGTVKMVAAAAITPGGKVYTAASGKVTGTHASGAFLVGQAVTAAANDGDIVEVAPCLPILDASGTTL